MNTASNITRKGLTRIRRERGREEACQQHHQTGSDHESQEERKPASNITSQAMTRNQQAERKRGRLPATSPVRLRPGIRRQRGREENYQQYQHKGSDQESRGREEDSQARSPQEERKRGRLPAASPVRLIRSRRERERKTASNITRQADQESQGERKRGRLTAASPIRLIRSRRERGREEDCQQHHQSG